MLTYQFTLLSKPKHPLISPAKLENLWLTLTDLKCFKKKTDDEK